MYEEYIKQLHIEAKLRNLADSSIKTYTDFILRFLEYTGKDPQDISAQDVRDFFLVVWFRSSRFGSRILRLL